MSTNLNGNDLAHLTRVRHRLLRAAFLSAVWQVQWTAWGLDCALADLASADPGAAEAVAARLANPPATPLRPDNVLDLARAAGAPGVEDWPRLTEQFRPYNRDAADVSGSEPVDEAQRIWAGLREHRPRTAVELALYLQRLPGGWLEHLFGAQAPDQVAPARTPQDYAPETAPVEHTDDCPACSEVQEICRYHCGWTQGVADARTVLATAATDPATQRTLLDHHRATPSESAPAEPTPEAFPPLVCALLRLLAEDDAAWSDLEELHLERQMDAQAAPVPTDDAWAEATG